MIDLTHDTLPELSWRPIEKTYDRVPPEIIMKDKILMKEWEEDMKNEYYRGIFDHRRIYEDVFKAFRKQGDEIQNSILASDINKDKNFLKEEQEIMGHAAIYINYLKRIKPFDIHKLQP